MDSIRCLGYADLKEEVKNGVSTYYLDVSLTLTSPSDNTPVDTHLRLPIDKARYDDMLAPMRAKRAEQGYAHFQIKESNLELILV